MKNPIVSFKPLTDDYFMNNLNGLVRLNESADSMGSTDSCLSLKSVFGQHSSLKYGESDALTGNARGYIQLAAPVISKALFGTSYWILNKILKMPKADFDGLCSFNKAYDIANDCLTNIYTGSTENYLFGPAYLQKVVEEMDIEEYRKDALLFEIWDNMYSKTKYYKDVGTVYNTKIDKIPKNVILIPVIGEYAFVKNPEIETRKDVQFGFTDTFINRGLQNSNARFILLYHTTKEILLRGFTTKVSVIPIDLRPKIDGRFDPVTKLYNDLMLKSKFLEDTALAGGNAEEIRLAYLKMVKAYDELTFHTRDNEPEKKCMYDKIKAKKGFIRSKFLSKRADYTGRSVVVVNPKLKINQCGIPTDMLPKLLQHHHLKAISGDKDALQKFIRKNDSRTTKEINEELSLEIESLGILDRIPACLNRAPTLHSLSYTSYQIVISKSRALEVHPLICEGQNMDFDGDTSGVNVPITVNGIEEALFLMGTLHKLFKPSNGNCVLVPRMDMLYGLYICTKSYSGKEFKNINGDYSDYDKLKSALLSQEFKVSDRVICNGQRLTAGKALIWLLYPGMVYDDLPTITKKTIKFLTEYIISKHDIKLFAYVTDELVDIGFNIATLYPASISIFSGVDEEKIKEPMQRFHTKMENPTTLYEAGFDDADSFNTLFADTFNQTDAEIEKTLLSYLTEENGFKEMVVSGARGDISNLIQIYSHKGLIAGLGGKTFKAVIENSFTSQLTPLEHFIAAYGSRKGLLDKSVKPAETGYVTRLMSHTTQSIVITNDDCGTSNGLVISKREIRTHLAEGENSNEDVEAILNNILVGRNIITASGVVHITKKNVSGYVKKYNEFCIRSPLTCQKPCCSVCYGTDLNIRGKAVVGAPVGFTAAMSIGEPGTQLTMKSFQKGGVAKKGGNVSEFDKIEALIKCESIAKIEKRESHPNYDPISWHTGKIKKVPYEANPDMYQITIEGSTKNIKVDKDAMLKDYVTRGEGMCVMQGDFDIKELQEYQNAYEAAKYFILTCYTTYMKNADVNMKHFEVLASGMLMYMVFNNGGVKGLRNGQFYTKTELASLVSLDKVLYHDNTNDVCISEWGKTVIVKPLMVGVKNVPIYKCGCMSNILMENVSHGMAKAAVTQTKDNFNEPLTLLSLGRAPSVGTYYKDYIKNHVAHELEEG